jgi:phage/conjugal plasmid C-4 type zinc finger TraR family protein
MAKTREVNQGFAAMRETLLWQRGRLVAEAAALAGREQLFGAAQKVDGAGSEDADVATELFEQELATALGQNVRAHLMDVDAALARIDAGHYGVCEDCGSPINPARLEALPQAKRCVGCQQKFETRGRLAAIRPARVARRAAARPKSLAA